MLSKSRSGSSSSLTSHGDSESSLSTPSASSSPLVVSEHSSDDEDGLSLYVTDSLNETILPPVITPPSIQTTKSVLVTGGAGFIGSHLTSELLSCNPPHKVVILDDFNDYYDPALKRANISLLSSHPNASTHLTVVTGSITSAELVEEIFSTHSITHVCHLAARAGVRPSIKSPSLYVDTNILGTTVLLDVSARHSVKNFVYASSSSVYGGSKSSYFSEMEDVSRPVSPYAATKRACELLAHTYSHLHDLPTTGLRFFTVFGPRGRPDMAPLMFIDRISNGVTINQYGDGSTSRDYTYISDIVDGIMRAIDRPYKCEVFNLGKGSGTSLREFIETVEKHTSKKAIKNIMPDQPGDVPYTCASTDKASRMLGYQSKVTFDDGIRRTVEWYNSVHGIKSVSVDSNDSPAAAMEKRAAEKADGRDVKRIKTGAVVCG